MKIDGLPVVDAKAPVFLKISDADVRKGEPGDPSCCAAALACMRQLHATDARVHMGRIYVKMGKKWLRYETPGSVRSEIIAFDRRGSFLPGSYKLNPVRPSEIADRGKQHGTKTSQTRPKSKHKKRIAPHFVKGVRTRMAWG